jgi:hypothetical protein
MTDPHVSSNLIVLDLLAGPRGCASRVPTAYV